MKPTIHLIIVGSVLFLTLILALTRLEGTNLSQADMAGAQSLPAILPLNDTEYPIPAGAFFVAPTGSDTNNGSQATPFKTIQRAITVAPANSTIVIRGGEYRESLAVNKKLTLQPYPHEKVWIKGTTVVSDWVKDGTIWRKDNWTYKFTQGGVDAAYIDPDNPLAAYPDMVFVNGKSYRQVGTKAQVTAEKFFVDYANNQLYIGSDPTNRTVEAAIYKYALNNSASGTIVRGLGFAQYATHRQDFSMVRTTGSNTLFENNTIAWSAAQGLGIYSVDSVARKNILIYNGIVGASTSKADRLIFEENYMASNNQELFSGWEAAGIKAGGGRDMIWRDNISENNINDAKGFWCDVSCYNLTLVRNIARNNSGHGIMYEISGYGIIASNISVGNGYSGIYLSEANNVQVYNNTMVKNRQNIRVIEAKRSNADTQIPYETKSNIIKNNILSNAGTGGTELYFVHDYSDDNHSNGNLMVSSSDYNAFFRTSSSQPTNLIQWDRGTNDLYATSLSAFQSAIGKDAKSISIDNQSTNPFFVDEAAGDYRLKTDSPAKGKGEALPASVAQAIGVTAGQPVDMGALKWTQMSTVPVPTATQVPTATLAPTKTPTPTPIPTRTPTPVPLVTKILNPTADAYVSSDRSSTNFGKSSALGVFKDKETTYLKFDVSSVRSLNIKSVKVKFRIVNSDGAKSTGKQYINYVSNNSWSETNITDRNKPAISSVLSPFDASKFNKGDWIIIDISTGLSFLKSQNTLTLGFTQDSYDGLNIYSRESSGNSPTLEVIYQ